MSERGLEERMEQAVVLPVDDSVRREVEEAVRAAGPSAQATWQDLLAEEAVLRAELGHLQVPVGLEARLATLPEVAARRRRSWLGGPFRIAAAAAVLLAVGFAYSLWSPAGDLRHVAELAAANFMLDAHVTERVDDPTALGGILSERLPFDVELPDLGPQFDLVGGRTCALGKRPVAFSVWEGPEGRCALYQFVPEDHGIDADTDRSEVRVACACSPSCGCCVEVWTEDRRGYALVTMKAPGPGPAPHRTE